MDKKILLVTFLFLLFFPPLALASNPCEINFLTTMYAKRIKTDLTFTESFYLKNRCNETVVLKTYFLTGTVVTDRGDQPTRVEELRLGYLEPLQENKVDVVIDTKNVEPGKYNPSLTIVAGCRDRDCGELKSTISFDITVVKGVTPPGAVNVSIPSKVYIGEEFAINASDVPSGAVVNLFHSYPEIYQKNVEQSATRWVWTGYINQTGSYSLSILISSAGVVEIKGPYTILVDRREPETKYIKMSLNPESPKDGDKVRITALDANTSKVLSNCKIYIDGDEQSSVTVEAKQSYDVRIECPQVQEAYEGEFSVSALGCDVLTTPVSMTENDEVTFTAVSTLQAVLTGTYRVDGIIEVGKYVALIGDHKVTFDNEKYSCEKGFNVAESPLKMDSTVPEKTKVNSNLTFTFSKSTDWWIKTDNNVTVSSGNSSARIDFTPKDEGSYTIYADGKNFGTFKAYLEWYEKYWLSIAIVVAMIFVITILILKFKGRRKPSPQLKFRLSERPSLPPGSEEVG